jgi:uncharacterized membrane protein (UPF0127 family)
MFRLLVLPLGVILAITLSLSCGEDRTKVIKTEPVTFTKEGELKLYKGTSDSLVTHLDIEIADTEYETQTGLMYRDEMAGDQGMLFIFPESRMHSFYMKNTTIPLDLLFIDEDLRVVHIVQNAQPLDETGLSSRVPVTYVLEVNSGFVSKWKLKTGDHIRYQKK